MKYVWSLRVVVDPNIVLEGLTQKGGAAGLIIALWLADLLNGYVSNALAYEYVDVLSRKLSTHRWTKITPVFGALLSKANFLVTSFSWRPSSPDPGDEPGVDCAMNAGALVVTSKVSDVVLAKESLGLQVMNPVGFVNHFAEQLELE